MNRVRNPSHWLMDAAVFLFFGSLLYASGCISVVYRHRPATVNVYQPTPLPTFVAPAPAAPRLSPPICPPGED